MRTTLLVAILALLPCVVSLAWVSPAPAAQAAGVVGICDEPHLLDALEGGGTVTFGCSGTITLTNTITIATDTTIDGSGQTVTVSGNRGMRVFVVNTSTKLNLHKLSIAHGYVPVRGVGGGGIYNQGGTVNVTDSTVYDNWGFEGGAIANYGALRVSNSMFSGNVADTGGGIDNRGTLTVSNSSFYGNSAAYSGSGIYNQGGTVNVSNSTFSENNAGVWGGGIDNRGALTVSNATFSGNSARAGRGGGINNINSGTAEVSNSTFSDNYALDGGGISNQGGLTLKNTSVANSVRGGNCYGTIADGGGNLSYPDTTCPGINGDPVLGPLQANGGPTQTMALGPGSAALDAAIEAVCKAPPVNNRDQRGVPRPHCDIGAYEAFFPTDYLYLPIVRK